MTPLRRQILLNALKLFDLLVMLAAFLLTTILIVHESGAMSLTEFLSMRIKVGNLVLFLALLALWHVIFCLSGLYNSRRMLGRRADAVDTLKAATVGALFIAVAAFIFHIRMVSLSFLFVFWVIVAIAAVTSRLLLRSVLERSRIRGRNLRNLLIIGTNSRALDFAHRIEASPERGYRITGFVDEEWCGLEEFQKSGHSLVCDFANVAAFLRNNVVDEVVMALPLRSMHTHAATIAALSEEQGITIRLLSNIFDLKVARAQFEEFDGVPFTANYGSVADGVPVFVKRGFDILLSSILLVGVAPIVIAVAVLIRLTSPGPVLFTQYRLGLNKRKFKIYKFRTMTADAEQKIRELEHLNEASGPVFKIKDDPRVTLVGRFLRRSSIDELPQLFNVLKGDMSLVGPRPLPVRDYEGFNQDWQRRRFSVRPGLTCLWQINGRSSISFEKWMQLDLQYIDRWSLRLDLEILLRTIPAVLKGSGAA